MISPETLRFFPLFAGQNHYMLKEIAMLSREITIEEGEWLFRQDEPALWLYLVLEGGITLALVIDHNGDGIHVEKLGLIVRGEILGWSSLVSPFIYTVGAIAVKNSKLVQIKAGGLRELLEDNPQFGYYIMKNVAEVVGERLRYKCIQLLSLKV